MTTTINLSMRTVIVTLGYLAALWFLFVIRDVVAIVLMAVVLSAALDPTVNRLERRGIPRGLALAILYVVLAGVLAIIVVTFVPVIGQQFSQLVASLPSLAQKIFSFTQRVAPSSVSSGSSVTSIISHFGTSLFQSVKNIIGGVISFVAVMVLTFYLTLEERGIRRAVTSVTPARFHATVSQVMEQIEHRLGQWLRGQLTLGLIIGVLVGTGLMLLHVKYALALALIAGLAELIPTVGPYIGMAPALIVAYSQFPALAAWTALLYWGIQQLENNFLVPRVMSKATGVNPIIVLLALLIGARLAGIVGILLSVPTVIIGQTILDGFLRERQEEEAKLAT